jgi:integrase
MDFSGFTLDQAAVKYLESKGEGTRRAYEMCLKRFVAFYGKGLGDYVTEIEGQTRDNEGKSLIERSRPGEDVARGFVKWHADNGYAPKATRLSMSALQNALKYYGISLSWGFIDLPPANPLPVNEKHQWTLEEMKQFIEAQDTLRDKALVALIFQSGLSIGDAMALNYGDVKRELEAGKIPIMIHLNRIKTGVDFRTFIGRDAVKLLGEYLKSRIPLVDGDPLFTKLGTNKRCTKSALQVKLRRLAPKLPFLPDDDGVNGFTSVRAHSLRSAFRSRLTGKMADTMIEFFLGHDIGAEKRTYINMPVEELRELYGNYEYLLKIERTSKEEAEEKSPKSLSPEAMAKISRLEASMVSVVGENTDFKQRVQELKVQDLELRNKDQDLEAKVDTLRNEVEYIRDIATQMINKYRVLKEVAPVVWEEIEKRTVPAEILREAMERDKEREEGSHGIIASINPPDVRPRNSKESTHR